MAWTQSLLITSVFWMWSASQNYAIIPNYCKEKWQKHARISVQVANPVFVYIFVKYHFSFHQPTISHLSYLMFSKLTPETQLLYAFEEAYKSNENVCFIWDSMIHEQSLTIKLTHLLMKKYLIKKNMINVFILYFVVNMKMD